MTAYDKVRWQEIESNYENRMFVQTRNSHWCYDFNLQKRLIKIIKKRIAQIKYDWTFDIQRLRHKIITYFRMNEKSIGILSHKSGIYLLLFLLFLNRYDWRKQQICHIHSHSSSASRIHRSLLWRQPRPTVSVAIYHNRKKVLCKLSILWKKKLDTYKADSISAQNSYYEFQMPREYRERFQARSHNVLNFILSKHRGSTDPWSPDNRGILRSKFRVGHSYWGFHCFPVTTRECRDAM